MAKNPKHKLEFYKQEKPSYDKYKKPIPITENHKKYHNLLKDKSKKIVVCNGWAGSSKTISSVYYACQAILNNEVKGFVIVKDMRDLDGYLPGDLEDKYIPKVRQLLIYAECFLQCDYKTLLSNKTIIIQPLAYIQGTDYTDYIMIVDEAQLITPELIYCICSRGASRIFINGDTSPMQSTAKHIKQGKDGLSFLLETMKKSNSFGVVTMNNEDDIVRDSYIKEIIINMQPKLEQFKKGENIKC